ncbi:MAG: hypothetical protein L6R48_10920 [Planctomycetes bacterium]|nr:hypothetical protein [Planctomycetota bacterium]
MIRFLYRLLCWHPRKITMVNVAVDSGDTDMLTICFTHCPKCGAFKLEWIYPNGGPKR